MDWLSYEHGAAIGAVLALTELVKRTTRIRPRFVPLVPLALALPIGAWVAAGESWTGWWPFIRAAIDRAMYIGPTAMALYDVWHSSIRRRR